MNHILITLLLTTSLINGCISLPSYKEPTSGDTASISLKDNFTGEIAPQISISPYVRVLQDTVNCQEAYSVPKKKHGGFTVAAGAPLTLSAGYWIGQIPLNRASPREAIFTFEPETGKHYELNVGYETGEGVYLQMFDSMTRELVELKQRLVHAKPGLTAKDRRGCNDSLATAPLKTRLNTLRMAGVDKGEPIEFELESDSATLLIEEVIYSDFGSQTFRLPLSVYEDASCKGGNRVLGFEGNSLGAMKRQKLIPTNREVTFLKGRSFLGTHCSILFTFDPKANGAYKFKTGDNVLNGTCWVEVIDLDSNQAVELIKKNFTIIDSEVGCKTPIVNSSSVKFVKKIYSSYQ